MPAGARPGRWARLFVVLLLASAAAFVIGVAVERSQGPVETGSEMSATTIEGTDEHARADEGSRHSDETGTESLLGVNPEGTGAVVGAVLASVAALDLREVTHQLHEDNGAVAALAALVTVLHLAAAATAAAAART
jgi:hypothetical protein